MSSILWYRTKQGQWDSYNAGQLLGVSLLARVREILTGGLTDNASPMYGWLDDSWWRIDVVLGQYNGDRSCQAREVPEEVRMKQLILGD